MFEPFGADFAGDPDERFLCLAAGIVAGVEGEEEFGFGDGGFGGEAHAAAADHRGAIGVGAAAADAVGVGEEGELEERVAYG